MEIKIKTLTPLWTGGVDGRVDRVHETGILGSLRWWYEVILRGLGSKVCDPTTKGKCNYDVKKPNNGLCDVCAIFGATGWRRRFRLVVEDGTQPDPLVTKKVSCERMYIDNEGRKKRPTWYIDVDHNQKPRSGNLTIQFHKISPDFQPAIIGGLLQFMADWAALGARGQLGFGIFEPLNARLNTRPLYEWISDKTGNCTYTTLPSLRNIFSARIRLKNARVEDTFNLKYDLRQLFRYQKNIRHFIMGTIKDKRMAAKVKISRPYNKGLVRVWGWIPEEASVYQNSWDRDKVVNTIYQHLGEKYTLEVWREMNSPRDTVMPNVDSDRAFLRSLLGLEERENAV